MRLRVGLKLSDVIDELIVHVDKFVTCLLIQMNATLLKVVEEQVTHPLVAFVHVARLFVD